MRKGKKIALWIAGIILAALLGLFAFVYFNAKRAVKIIIPELESLEEARIKISGDTAFIDAALLFKNKSFVKLNIDSFIYKVTLDTMLVLDKAQDLDLQMEPSEEDTIHLPLALPYKALIKERQRLNTGDSVQITFDLRLVYSTWLGQMQLPFKKTVTVAVPEPPEVELQELEYKGRDGSKLNFNVHLNITNKGNLDLSLSDLSYELDVKDHFQVRGKEQKTISLKPHSNTTVVLPVSFAFDNLFKTLIQIATNTDKVNYDLKLKALFQSSKLKGKKNEIFIEQSGVTELKK